MAVLGLLYERLVRILNPYLLKSKYFLFFFRLSKTPMLEKDIDVISSVCCLTAPQCFTSSAGKAESQLK